MTVHGADLLSLLRLGLALPSAHLTWTGNWDGAAMVFVLAVISDLADGPLARRRGAPHPNGALLDHGADALFVSTTLGALAARGLVSALLPVMIVLAFAQYAWDSGAHRGRPLRGNAIGRINGIAYYALAGALIAAEGWVPSAQGFLSAVGLGLIGTTAFSMSRRMRHRE